MIVSYCAWDAFGRRVAGSAGGVAHTPTHSPTPTPNNPGDINETVIRETAQLLVDSGLRDAGYVYLNLCVRNRWGYRGP